MPRTASSSRSALSLRSSVRYRVASRGLTLIEILVVIAIAALISGVVIAGSGQLPSARLKGSATMIASAVKVAFTRATATSRDLRLVMDLDQQMIWLEQSDVPMLVQAKDKEATGGADPVTTKEQEAIAEGERILKGPPIPKPRFTSIDATGFGDTLVAVKGHKPLQRGITFRSVQTTHDDKPRTSGRAYLYFWPGGRTELASIQIRIGDSDEDSHTMTLAISPLTGKVTIKSGPVDLEIPTDDNQKSDREESTF
jgi:general secretion pathway protein H